MKKEMKERIVPWSVASGFFIVVGSFLAAFGLMFTGYETQDWLLFLCGLTLSGFYTGFYTGLWCETYHEKKRIKS